jgi:hypothetical protein
VGRRGQGRAGPVAGGAARGRREGRGAGGVRRLVLPLLRVPPLRRALLRRARPGPRRAAVLAAQEQEPAGAGAAARARRVVVLLRRRARGLPAGTEAGNGGRRQRPGQIAVAAAWRPSAGASAAATAPWGSGEIVIDTELVRDFFDFSSPVLP